MHLRIHPFAGAQLVSFPSDARYTRRSAHGFTSSSTFRRSLRFQFSHADRKPSRRGETKGQTHSATTLEMKSNYYPPLTCLPFSLVFPRLSAIEL